MGFTRLEITVYTDNAPAVALYRKFGFVVEGTARGYALRDGRLVDAFMMARHARDDAQRGGVREATKTARKRASAADR